MINAQKYLYRRYPKKSRGAVQELDLREKDLKGDLDLISFTSLTRIYISGNAQLGKIENKHKRWQINVYEDAQQWLTRKYSDKEVVEKIKRERGEIISGSLIIADYSWLKEIDISGDSSNYGSLTHLKVVNHPYLTYLNCARNKITNFEISNCPHLTELYCTCNQLTNLSFLQQLNPEKLTILNISCNKFSPCDLTPFASFKNLENLRIGYNSFYGSLAPLKNCLQLKWLNISCPEINGGLEYLPDETMVYVNGCSLEKELKPYNENKRCREGWEVKKWKQAHLELVIKAKLENLQPQEQLAQIQQMPFAFFK